MFVEPNKEDWKNIIIQTEAIQKFKKRSRSSRSSGSQPKDHRRNEKHRKESSNRLPSNSVDKAQMVIQNLSKREEVFDNTLRKGFSTKIDGVLL